MKTKTLTTVTYKTVNSIGVECVRTYEEWSYDVTDIDFNFCIEDIQLDFFMNYIEPRDCFKYVDGKEVELEDFETNALIRVREEKFGSVVAILDVTIVTDCVKT